jgi:hypothetical protein
MVVIMMRIDRTVPKVDYLIVIVLILAMSFCLCISSKRLTSHL